MKTILVPLDGSALAEQVLPSIRMLAPILGAKVQLLLVSEANHRHVLADLAPGATLGAQQEYEPDSWPILRQQAEDYLAPLAAQLRAAGVETSFEVRLGTPAETIVEVTDSEQIALIAMATHGYGGLRRWALGSVADKVVQAADVPVLVVRGREQPVGERTLKRILVPLDGSPLARQALPLAVGLATSAGAELILLTVAAPALGELGEVIAPHTRSDEMLAALRDQVLGELDGLADELRARQVPLTPVAVEGFVAEAIIDEAARQKADLIVMATHGYSGLKRWALGSVADKVLHATATPLLLVRAQAADK